MAAFPLEVVGAVFQVFGSAFAKFAFGGDSVPAAFAHRHCDAIIAGKAAVLPYGFKTCDVAEYAVRAVFFVMLLLANAFGMMLVLKGMARSGSLKATVLATATNTLVTAAVGRLLFGEVLSLKWGLGATMIVTGVVLLNDGSKTKADGKERKAEKAASRPSKANTERTGRLTPSGKSSKREGTPSRLEEATVAAASSSSVSAASASSATTKQRAPKSPAGSTSASSARSKSPAAAAAAKPPRSKSPASGRSRSRGATSPAASASKGGRASSVTSKSPSSKRATSKSSTPKRK